METLERITMFRPAFDKRSDTPSKNYGIGDVRCYMVLKGTKGAVHFTFGTGMFLESTMDEYARAGRLNPVVENNYVFILNRPMGYDVGYHSLTPLSEYEKENGGRPDCDWLDGKPCYGDGSALRAEEWMKIFLEKGSDEIWKMLEVEYEQTFKDVK